MSELRAALRAVCILVAMALVLTSAAMAQVTAGQTGALQGTVRLQDAPAPGVTVTVTSPAMQGARSAVTGATGDYILRALPPGDYKAVFTLQGMKEEDRTVTVSLATSTRLDLTMSPSEVSETIQVTGEAAVNELEHTTISQNLTTQAINSLPVARNPTALALIAPSVNTGQLAGEVEISGGFGYDTQILINGVNVTDQVFGQQYSLFIEDAIQEEQVMSSSISAEYGHFGGGIVNAVTKSGGNDFSGSFRVDQDNNSYRSRTPLEISKGTKLTDKNNDIYSGTLGGYVVKDRLWFFGAARKLNTSVDTPLSITGVNYPQTTDEKRYEGKLTWNIADSHSVQASYIKRDFTQQRPGIGSMSPDTITAQLRPQSLYVGRYSGVLSSTLFAEASYSEAKANLTGGGSTRSIVDSPFVSQTLGTGFNAPYFDATDGEDRNNKQANAGLSFFLNSAKAGSHDLKVGIEDYRSIDIGGNSQTSTDFVFYTDPVFDAAGNPVFGADGHLIPTFVPFPGGNYYSAIGNWIGARGSEANLRVQSAYVNDNWHLNNHLSFNLGARYEKGTNTTSDHARLIDSSRVSPRLSMAVDPTATGRWRLDASYSQYASTFDFGHFLAASNTGNPSLVYGVYIGPPGQGRDFAPGFDPKNYYIVYAGSPTQNVSFAKGVKSPLVTEWTLGAGVTLERGGYMRVAYINRKTTDFLEATTCVCFGRTEIIVQGNSGGFADNVVYRNSNAGSRDYRAAVLQGRYNITSNWSLEGNWTHEFSLDGTYEGQVGQTLPTSGILNKPEFFTADRDFPDGHLSSFQADVAHLWSLYRLGLGRAGTVDLGLLGSYYSPNTYSLAAANVPLSSKQLAKDPGYVSPPSAQTLYFGKRGSQQFNSYTQFDFHLNYSIPVWKTVAPYFIVNVVNVLNDHTLIGWNTTVSRDRSAGAPVDANGLATNFIKGASFGKARNNNDFPTPRTFSFALGLHF